MKYSFFLPFALIIASLTLTTDHDCHAQETISRKVTKEDMPRIPSTAPDKALDTFKLAKGFTLEMVAAEPSVGDPVDACFDEHGRMFVAEMHGYPFSQEPTKLNPERGQKVRRHHSHAARWRWSLGQECCLC
ncbi:hypothetical protein F1728_04725 [Gimesia benthica]|uniref:DUF7133 domain-containing protein n=1 Tax=Gimesia benthica TaxID=2608982 RepID=A0A6I6A7S4_9PLAN|nr:hypothetical protein [Gimesia benthica]QGQ22038.1 hypothetical protein F1728_04725 [Gimesia benthica]